LYIFTAIIIPLLIFYFETFPRLSSRNVTG